MNLGGICYTYRYSHNKSKFKTNLQSEYWVGMNEVEFPSDALEPESDVMDQSSIELNDFQTMVDQTILDAYENTDSSQTNIERTSDRYLLMDTLGEGAMGLILLAQDKLLSRKVAYKHVRTEFSGHPQMLNRFYKEAQITSQLEHPGIIPVYSMEQMSDKSLAYAMKWLKGSTLKEDISQFKQRIKDSVPDLNWNKEYRSLLNKFLIVCDTIHYAHSKGVVHRDLKPSNIMLGKYHEVYVLDWGIATLKGSKQNSDENLEEVLLSSWWDIENEERTQLGKIVGTPRYMSPEQARGDAESLLPASDQYALGLILFEISFLKSAYTASTLEELIEKVQQNQIVDFGVSDESVVIPPAMHAILHQALAAKPQDRYASVADLARDIRAFLQDQPTQVLPDNLWRKTLRWSRHHPQGSLLMMMALILISGLITSTSLYLNQQVLKKNRLRQTALNTLLTEVTLTARSIDSQLSHFESLLERLSARAIESDLRGSARNLSKQSATTLQQSPDYTQGTWLTSKTRFQTHLLSVVDGQKKIHARALNPEANPLELLQRGDLKRSPLKWSTVVFDRQPGTIQVIYPGTSETEQVLSIFKHGLENQDFKNDLKNAYAPHWGATQNDLLPVYQALYSEDHQYRGWAGLAIEQKQFQALLKQTDLPGLQEVQLLSENLEPELFWSRTGSTAPDLPPKLNTLLSQTSGYFELGKNIYGYQKLATLPWTLIFKVDRSVLLSESHHES